MSDARREPEDTSGVRQIPQPVGVPAGEEDNPFFGFIARQEARRDFMFVMVFEELAEARAIRAKLDGDRADTLNRLQQIAGVVHDHSLAMGQVVQGLEKLQRCMRKVEDTMELVRQQQVSHGKELARVGSEMRGLSDHFEVAMTHTRAAVHSTEERLDAALARLDALETLVWEHLKTLSRDKHAADAANNDPPGETPAG